jgi:DNA repair protein RAD16
MSLQQSNNVFQGVVIPKSNASMSQQRQRLDRRNPSSSIADSMESSDYETPATSTIPTPTDTSKSHRPGRQPAKVGATARALELRTSAHALNPTRSMSKKRRVQDLTAVDSEEDMEARDLKLAKKLQAEEFENEDYDFPIIKRRKGSHANPITLTESDDDVPLANIKKKNVSAKVRTRRHAPVPDSVSSGLSDLNSFLGTEESDIDDSESVLSLATDDSDVDALGNATNTFGNTRRVSNQRVRRYQTYDPDRHDPTRRRQIRERERLERAHPEIVTMWDALRAIDIIKPVPAEQPEGINRRLKPFQLEGLNWMIRQEQSHWKGGLLGDEMGMGKTIQAVSLIMSDYPAKNPTLVVVPPVALMQWQKEITDYTSGKLNVLVYHISANPKCKSLTKQQLKKYNVIMISYSGLESMYRKENKGWNRGDGIVKEDSILHSIKFHRLILDEAHSIKSRTTSVAKACFALKADYKWCLSGTPVQNRIGEFFSLLRFLEVQPFACYFCKYCKCKELHWSQDENKMCTHCNHSGFQHVSVFNQEILNPITQAENDKLRQTGLDNLRLITDRIMLRRVKRDHTSSMELPPKDIIIHNEFFGEIERDFSQSIMSNNQRQFDTYVSRGVMLNNYANIFGLIMQMRQVANHPDLILRRNAEGGQNVLVCCICDEPAEEAIRSRCHHEFCRECAKSYVRSFEGQGGDADCPKCHIPLVIDFDQPDIEQDEDNVKKSSIINRIKMDDWTSSTKIEMLVYDLYKLRSKKQTHKSIVFSQFTSMLQLVQWRLQKSGFSTVMLDGSMSPAQRQKSIDYFMNNVDVEVFLVSLKAGGVALNLTEASRVFIIDP